jgi:hypothetical protein
LKSNATGAWACDWCLRLMHRRLVADFHTSKHNMAQVIRSMRQAMVQALFASSKDCLMPDTKVAAVPLLVINAL